MIKFDNKPIRRKLPFPIGSPGEYQGCLVSITNDIDGTDIDTFLEYHKLFHEKGLDIADSFFAFNNQNCVILRKIKFFFMRRKPSFTVFPNNLFSFRKFYLSGWFDSIHTFGEEHKVLFCSRLLVKVMDYIFKLLKIRIKVWIDHSQSPYNFGSSHLEHNEILIGISHKHGDDETSNAFHTDITLQNNQISDSYGLKIVYAWTHFSPFDIENPNFDYLEHNYQRDIPPSKYSTRDILIPSVERNGYKYHRFIRFYYLKKVDTVIDQPSAININDYLNPTILEEVSELGHFSSIATHLYKFSDSKITVSKALEGLIDAQRTGRILVSSTVRMLDYARMDKYLVWSYDQDINTTKIFINLINDNHLGAFIPKIDDLRGLTIYVQNPWQVKIFIQDQPVMDEDLVRNANDGFAESISIRWYSKNSLKSMLNDSINFRTQTLDCFIGKGETFNW
jgi:hypothetical protein